MTLEGGSTRHAASGGDPGRPGRLGNPVITDGSLSWSCQAAGGTGRGTARSGEGETVRQGSETDVKLMELKEETVLSREEAAARLHAIADELASGNDVVIEREDMRFVAHVPDQVHLKVEFEIEDDGTELEIELTW